MPHINTVHGSHGLPCVCVCLLLLNVNATQRKVNFLNVCLEPIRTQKRSISQNFKLVLFLKVIKLYD